MGNTLNKAERLTGKDKIDTLYKDGKSITEFPFKLMWIPVESKKDLAPVQAIFSVPKRRFKSAVKRNRIKRLLKEVYRSQKHELYNALENKNANINVFVIYLGKEMPNYKSVSDKIIVLLSRLKQEISESVNHD